MGLHQMDKRVAKMTNDSYTTVIPIAFVQVVVARILVLGLKLHFILRCGGLNGPALKFQNGD